jgi:hypothetical protein
MDEKVNGRRGFLKGFGLGGVILGGAVGGYHAVTREVVALANGSVSTGNGATVNSAAVLGTPDISHLAPREGIPTLMITGDNRPPEPPKPITYMDALSKYTIACATPSMYVGSGHTMCPSNEMNKVSMAVGKDDRLWIKVGDGWKRVVLEG